MKILLTHIFNEEYLLPWWLNHHRNYFDHGIIIDYNSNDRSLDIIREYCPTWDIIQSKNSEFGAYVIDEEIKEYEDKYPDGVWKVTLTVTEFLIGKYDILLENLPSTQYLIPCLYFIDSISNRKALNDNIPLWEQLYNGIPISDSMVIRRARSLHNYNISYPVGRHFDSYNTNNFIIFNYGFAPMTEEFIQRKLQIQHKIPQFDKNNGLGTSHTYFGQGLDKDKLMIFYNDYIKQSIDLTNIMRDYLNLNGL